MAAVKILLYWYNYDQTVRASYASDFGRSMIVHTLLCSASQRRSFWNFALPVVEIPAC